MDRDQRRRSRDEGGPWALVLVSLFMACSSNSDPYDPVYTMVCTPGEMGCDGDRFGRCNDEGSGWVDTVVCEGHTPECSPELGCVSCLPGARRCQGNSVLQCEEDGVGWALVEDCVGEAVCHEGRCGADCARAAVYRSYEGCEYWAVTLMNSQLPSDFEPALVIGNRNDEPALVTVSQGRFFSRQVTVAPDATATLELPWDLDLKNANFRGESANYGLSAYHVESSLPVTVYQFNPLEYSLSGDCAGDDPNPLDGRCYSYTNDASLLLPVPVLTEHYIVLSRPNLGIRYEVADLDQVTYSYSPSVLAVVNPQDREVSVEVLPSAPIASGPGVPPLEADEAHTFEVAPGGVLQLAARSPESCEADWTEPDPVTCGVGRECYYGYCNLIDRDLTGTEISASAPVAVFGAHDCDFIPYNRWACDHLEEQLFPYETWAGASW